MSDELGGVFGWRRKREYNKQLRELHEALAEAKSEHAIDGDWWWATIAEIAEESEAIEAILQERVLSFPPKTGQMAIARRFNMQRDRLRVIEGWLVRRLRGRLRCALGGIDAAHAAGGSRKCQ